MPLDTSQPNPAPSPKQITISPPRFERASVHIRGTAPYMQHRFSTKARTKMEETQRAGSTAKKGRNKEARDFEADWQAALYLTKDGGYGIPAPSFRNAMIDACRMTGFAMTRAKMSVFVEATGYDAQDNVPLVLLDRAPDTDRIIMPARNESGVADLRCRPIWSQWEAMVQLRWDADQFTASDVLNLLARAGIQVGVGEGRPYSKNSNGLGYGTWELVP